jgi:hypothetical protein
MTHWIRPLLLTLLIVPAGCGRPDPPAVDLSPAQWPRGELEALKQAGSAVDGVMTAALAEITIAAGGTEGVRYFEFTF